MDELQKILPVTTVKKNLLEIIKNLDQEDSTVTVTKNGMAVGVIMSQKRYEGLLETIEILAAPGILKTLSASADEFRSGKVHSHDEVWSD